jgi:P27 family predicted phage terminase small subunit
MGAIGSGRRPTKTDEQKKEEGWYRPSNSFPLPEGNQTIPDAPDDLSSDERDIWDDLTFRLAPTKLLYSQDFYNLKIFVQTYARYEKNKKIVDQEGTSLDGIRFTPAYRVMIHAQTALAKMSGKFGLSPSDRLGLGEREEKDAGPNLNRPK